MRSHAPGFMVLSAVDLYGSPHVGVRWSDRPKWSSQSLFERCISGTGLIRAIRPGGDELKISVLRATWCHAAALLQRNDVLFFHMA